MKFIIFIIAFFVGTVENDFTEPATEQKKMMIDSVNQLRSKGCYCGRRYMDPVPPVAWDGVLYKSAFTQAKEMKDHNFFAHFSKDGLNIGERLQKAGYDWMVAGENLGEGQKTFDEVLNDWLKSYQHCKMLMHPRVEEMAVAKVDKYWVQHFGKKMPPKNK